MSTTNRVASAFTVAVLLTVLQGRRETVAGQTGCTFPADSTTTMWLQGVLDGPVSVKAREVLGPSHLQHQIVIELGTSPGDDAICSAIFASLPENERNSLTASASAYQTLYYQVGDRYLLVWTPLPDAPQVTRPTIVVSFDSQFNRIDAGIW